MNITKDTQDTSGHTTTPSWLEQLVKQAFSKLACPMNNNGMYAELQRLVADAYNLGRLLGNRNLSLSGNTPGAELQHQNKTLIISHPGHYLPLQDKNNEAALD